MLRTLHWSRWVLLAAFVAFAIPVLFTIGIADPGTFLATSLGCGLPFFVVASLVIFLLHADIRSKRNCGFCGYDRSDLKPEQLCPECGRRGDDAGAPGFKPVGRRHIPIWIWGPGVVSIPAMITLLRFAPERFMPFVALGCVGILAASIIAGVWHAWNQAK